MKYLISLSIAFIIASTSIFSGNMNYSIIPEPVKIKSLDGSFSLNRETVLVYGSDEDLNSVNFLKKYLLDYYGIELAVEKASARTAKSNFIKFVLSKRLAKQVEGYYTANVGKKGVILTAGTPQGLFYAAQTLIQLLPVKSAYTSVKKAKERLTGKQYAP
jgi:hexosaminidase